MASADAWSQSTLTWDNRPPPVAGAAALDSAVLQPTQQTGPVQFDVTPQVLTELDGDKVVSLAVQAANNANGAVFYYTKEGATHPRLVLTIKP